MKIIDGNPIQVISTGDIGTVVKSFPNSVGDLNYIIKFPDREQTLGYGEWEVQVPLRDFNKVFQEIKDIIPATELEFHKDLDWVIKDAFYKAPEETIPWHRCFEILQEHIATPKTAWQITIWSIFSGVSEDEIRKQIDETV